MFRMMQAGTHTGRIMPAARKPGVITSNAAISRNVTMVEQLQSVSSQKPPYIFDSKATYVLSGDMGDLDCSAA